VKISFDFIKGSADVNKAGRTVWFYWWCPGSGGIIIRAYHISGGNAMGLGNHLFHARKKKGLSQEEVAEKLGISRQTVSKWETDETLPDICQSKKMAVLYGLSLDELVEFDIDIKEIQEVIDRTSEEVSDKIDWTKAWSGKYPILSRYREEVDMDCYAAELDKLLRDLEKKYGYNELDSFLVLKDILASVWKGRKKNSK
jgi:transcriptional regulator with XRE-family HTH domain